MFDIDKMNTCLVLGQISPAIAEQNETGYQLMHKISSHHCAGERSEETIDKARKASHHADGKCSMCAVGDEPVNGLHRGQHKCGNNDTCLACHNAGMECGDQCQACGRIEKHKTPMGG